MLQLPLENMLSTRVTIKTNECSLLKMPQTDTIAYTEPLSNIPPIILIVSLPGLLIHNNIIHLKSSELF